MGSNGYFLTLINSWFKLSYDPNGPCTSLKTPIIKSPVWQPYASSGRAGKNGSGPVIDAGLLHQKKFRSKRSYDKMLIDWVRSGWTENIWLSVKTHGTHCAQSVHPDLKPNIFLSCPPTQSGQWFLLHVILLYLKVDFFSHWRIKYFPYQEMWCSQSRI